MVSTVLKMWKGSENVMYDLECLGLFEQVKGREIFLESILLFQWDFFFVILLLLYSVCTTLFVCNFCRFFEMMSDFVEYVLRDITRFLWRLPDFFSPRGGVVSSPIHTTTQFQVPSLVYNGNSKSREKNRRKLK